jgi:hypothetical protein
MPEDVSCHVPDLLNPVGCVERRVIVCVHVCVFVHVCVCVGGGGGGGYFVVWFKTPIG